MNTIISTALQLFASNLVIAIKNVDISAKRSNILKSEKMVYFTDSYVGISEELENRH